MKILHIFDHSIPLHSGYTFRSLAILEQQRAFGWETFHITSMKHDQAVHGKCELEEHVEGLRFFRTLDPKNYFSGLPLISQMSVINSLKRRLEEVVMQVQPDILHAHSPALNGLAALSVSRKYNIPLVYEIRAFWEDAAVDHGSCKEGDFRYRLTRAMETHVVRRANAVTTICQGLRADLVGRGIPNEKITVIPNAVDVTHFSLNAKAEHDPALSLELSDKVVLGFVGSFYAYEGLSLLLESLPKLLESIPNMRILLVGGGPEDARLRELAESLGVGDKVVFTGRVPHDDVMSYYSLIDCLVYPRIAMRLTNLVTPLKPLEAMAQEKLVLASDVGGHKELIEPGVTGELFCAGDADDLVKKAVSLLKSPEKWSRMKKAGREYVEKERNWTVSVENYRPIYQDLCK